MKPITTFRTGAALGSSFFCLSGSIDGFAPEEQYTRVIIYDEREEHVWSFYEEDHRVSAICTWKDPAEGFEIFVTMSDEGDVVFSDYEPISEKIPEAGVFSDDAKGWGYMSAVRQIGDLLYAVGGAGQIYQRTGLNRWRHMDDGVLQSPSTDGRLLLTDINGTNEKDIYVCGDIPGAYGLEGRLFHWDGITWTLLELPTTERLTRMFLRQNGELWVCGANGTLLHGDWSHGFTDVSTIDDNQLFYSLTEFNDRLYLASNLGLFTFDGNDIRQLTSGLSPELRDTHVVQAVDGVLWSFGFKDIVKYDGAKWIRINHPDNSPI